MLECTIISYASIRIGCTYNITALFLHALHICMLYTLYSIPYTSPPWQAVSLSRALAEAKAERSRALVKTDEALRSIGDLQRALR